jgi:uncharacterized protein (TIGR03437 family)
MNHFSNLLVRFAVMGYVLLAASALPHDLRAADSFFRVRVDGSATIVVRVAQPVAIQEAREILAGRSTNEVMTGKIVPVPAAWNLGWHFHLDPLTVGFTDVASQGCQAPASQIDAAPTNVGGSTLPGFRWCPSVTVLEEIPNLPPGSSGALDLTLVSAADYSELGLSPGSIVSAFGPGFASNTSTATVQLFNNSGNIVAVSGIVVAPGQVDFLLPEDLPPGRTNVNVVTGSKLFDSTAYVLPYGPSLFSVTASGLAAAWITRLRADNSTSIEPVFRLDPETQTLVAAPVDLGPETDQVYLSLLGTGIRHRTSLDSLAVVIGGLMIRPTYAGAYPSVPGVDQINLLLPRGLAGNGTTAIWTTSQIPFENYICNQPVCVIAGPRTLDSQPVQIVVK